MFKGDQVFFIEGVFQAEHRNPVFELDEFCKRHSPDPAARGVIRLILGEPVFQLKEFVKKQIVFSVRYRRVVQNIIAMGVLPEEFLQFPYPFLADIDKAVA